MIIIHNKGDEMRLTNVLDTDQVVNEIKEIVSKNPSFRYPMYYLCECNGISEEEECDYHLEEACRYFNSAKDPVCVIGHWLASHNLNTPEKFGVESLNQIEGEHAIEVLEKVQQNNNFAVSDDARDFLVAMQRSQDEGISWQDSFNVNLPFWALQDVIN